MCVPLCRRLILDELMMNLFSLIAEQVRNKQELFDHEGKIMESLINSGYRIQDADAALTLMQTFVQKQQDGTYFGPEPVAGARVMNNEERSRFTLEAFSFASKLAILGIISEELRDDVLDRALTLYAGRIELDQMKALVALTLFANNLESEDNPPSFRRKIKRTAWN
jgi:uncharacterized protein Smg (DUF494 family)